MLIRSNPDFLILPSPSLSEPRKHKPGLQPEVQRLWRIVKKSKEGRVAPLPHGLVPEMPHTGEDHCQPKPIGGFDDLRVAD